MGKQMAYTGEIIAVSTVLCWTVSVQFFEAASKRVGAGPVNIIRLTTALLLFGILILYRTGHIIPLDFPVHAWVYLSLSGIVGFFMGDIFLFKALVEIGPRVAMLIFSLSAPMAAVIGWIFLKETYVLHQWLGMLVTLSGVCIVILERNNPRTANSKYSVRTITGKGVLLGFGAMLGQACGYVLSKTGMQSGTGFLDAFAATQIRAMAAFICFFILFTVTGKWSLVQDALKNAKAFRYTVIGSAIGPFLGVSLSLLTLHYMTAGVASTFLSLVPVFIIPFSVLLHKEHVSLKAVAGAFTAVTGIYLLTWS